MTTTTRIDDVLKQHASHLESVTPGAPAEINGAATEDSFVVQGDLLLSPRAKPPQGYEKVEKPQRQLVPEAGAGSHHRLSSLEGVEMWAPPGWSVDNAAWDNFAGPWFRCDREVTVVHEPGHAHPHGPVTIEAGVGVLCSYQREYDQELKRERRQMD